MPADALPTSDSSTLTLAGDEDVSLLEIFDHVLNSGVVIHGSLVISLAGVDLVYVGLNVVLTSVETALRNMSAQPATPASTTRLPSSAVLPIEAADQ